MQIERCSNEPSSKDIQYWVLWKEEWKDMSIEEIKADWYS